MEQLYAIQVDLCKQYPKNAEIYLQAGEARYMLHSGGRGNGAQGGLYTSKQINRIIGKYAEGAAKAIPVAFNFTQKEAYDNAEEAYILGKARAWGVDNWVGWMEWASDEEESDD